MVVVGNRVEVNINVPTPKFRTSKSPNSAEMFPLSRVSTFLQRGSGLGLLKTKIEQFSGKKRMLMPSPTNSDLGLLAKGGTVVVVRNRGDVQNYMSLE